MVNVFASSRHVYAIILLGESRGKKKNTRQLIGRNTVMNSESTRMEDASRQRGRFTIGNNDRDAWM